MEAFKTSFCEGVFLCRKDFHIIFSDGKLIVEFEKINGSYFTTANQIILLFLPSFPKTLATENFLLKNYEPKKSYIHYNFDFINRSNFKILYKNPFFLGEEIPVFGWFRILFVENEGMAWGAKIPGEYGKLILTLFRIVAIGGIGYWLWDSVRKNAPRILVFCIALVFAGAMGNIIDSVFYGIIFNDSHHQVATLFPEAGGYGTIFHGKVVDMLYFPLYGGIMPDWVPIWGGEYFTFFDPVFNIADSSISVGVILLLFFNKKAFPNKDKKIEPAV